MNARRAAASLAVVLAATAITPMRAEASAILI